MSVLSARSAEAYDRNRNFLLTGERHEKVGPLLLSCEILIDTCTQVLGMRR